MHKRRNRIYNIKPSPIRRGIAESSVQSNGSFTVSMSEKPTRAPDIKQSLALSTQEKNTQGNTSNGRSRRLRLERLRKVLRVTVALSVVLSACAGAASFILDSDSSALSLHRVISFTVLALSSLLQVPLVVLYWTRSLKYRELLRVAYRLEPVPVQRASSHSTALCALECACNLVVLLPNAQVCWEVSVNGAYNSLCVADLAFVAVLARNYHAARLLFLVSRFSEMRVNFYAKLAAVELSQGFITRCWLTEYGHRLIAAVYFLAVLFPSIVKYVLERKARSSLWDELWIIAYTQATIGYGDSLRTTEFGRTTIVVSCLAGIFVLGILNAMSSRTLRLTLPQSTVCAELLLAEMRSKEREFVVVLVQRWWRLVRLRAQRVQHGKETVAFFSRLGKFRKLLARRERVKYGRFEYHVQAFQQSVHGTVHRTNEYLSPVLLVSSLVLAI